MHTGPGVGNILLLLLAAAPGLFFASTSLLPSSFAMYLLTLAAAFALEARPLPVVASAVMAVIWGWPVAGGTTLSGSLASWLHLLVWQSAFGG